VLRERIAADRFPLSLRISRLKSHSRKARSIG